MFGVASGNGDVFGPSLANSVEEESGAQCWQMREVSGPGLGSESEMGKGR